MGQKNIEQLEEVFVLGMQVAETNTILSRLTASLRSDRRSDVGKEMMVANDFERYRSLALQTLKQLDHYHGLEFNRYRRGVQKILGQLEEAAAPYVASLDAIKRL